jgi:hypothetical protein
MNGECKQKVAAVSAFLKTYQEPFFVKHEWEELLNKLTCSEDPELRGIGQREQLLLKER